MEEIKPKPSQHSCTERNLRDHPGFVTRNPPEPPAMTTSKEIRRQLGWFLGPEYRGHDR